MSRQIKSAGLSIIFIILVPFVAIAAPYGYTVEAGSLQRIDLSTGDRSLIGETGAAVLALAFDSEERLIATDGASLMELDTSNGTAEVLVPLSFGVAQVTGLAFDHDGALWMSAETFTDQQQLFRVDPTLGTVTAILDLDLSALTARGDQLLAFGADLLAIDLSTLAVEVLGEGFDNWETPAPFGPYRVGSGADADPSGRWWGLLDSRVETDPPNALLEIAQFDHSGHLSSLFVDHSYGNDIVGLAIDPVGQPIVEVPTLSQWALAILALGLALAGVRVCNRRARN